MHLRLHLGRTRFERPVFSLQAGVFGSEPCLLPHTLVKARIPLVKLPSQTLGHRASRSCLCALAHQTRHSKNKNGGKRHRHNSQYNIHFNSIYYKFHRLHSSCKMSAPGLYLPQLPVFNCKAPGVQVFRLAAQGNVYVRAVGI